MFTLISPVAASRKGEGRRQKIHAICRSMVGEECRIIDQADDLIPLADGSTMVLVILLDDCGINMEWTRMLQRIRSDQTIFRNVKGGVIVDGPSELYTKSVGREAVLACNMSGCAFPGKSLVEATGSLYNQRVSSKLMNCSLEEAYFRNIEDLIRRLQSEPLRDESKKKKLLVLHASIRSTSNTMRLWEKVKVRLGDRVQITEISLRNGEISDCAGCPFTMCMHFSERGQCFYGGVIVEQVYPAVEECDAIVMLCPNYNDAISANLSAFINRLTALYRKRPFYEKSIYGIIVSGYSGGDLVAMQLISALNMNKAFRLPGNFCMMETANDPGSIELVEGIEERAASFAERIWNG